MIKALFINVESGEPAKTVAIQDENQFKEFSNLIGCEYVDCVKRYVNGKAYRFIVDDVGALKKNPTPSAINRFSQIMLYGNVVVCGEENAVGELTSLTDEDIDNLLANVHRFFPNGRPRGYCMIILDDILPQNV